MSRVTSAAVRQAFLEVSNSMVDTTVKSEDSKRMSKEEMACS